jgi:hypothetical protein
MARIRPLLLAVVVALGVLVVPGTASGADGPPPTTAQVWVVHGVPGVTVDVCVDGTVVIEDLEYLDAAGPLTVPVATYELALTTSTCDSEIYLTEVDTTEPYYALVATLDPSSNLDVLAFGVYGNCTPAGNGQFQALHAAGPTGPVTVTVDGTPADTDLGYGEYANVDGPVRTFALSVTRNAGGASLLSGPVTLIEGVNLVSVIVPGVGGDPDVVAAVAFPVAVGVCTPPTPEPDPEPPAPRFTG